MAAYETDPADAAARLLDEHDEAWVRVFAVVLTGQLGARTLLRIQRVWQLSATDLGDLLAVSAQSATRWASEGVPPSRVEQIGELQGITELLERYVKPDRIASVVRARVPELDGQSLLTIVAAGRSADALAKTRQMFSFGDLHE